MDTDTVRADFDRLAAFDRSDTNAEEVRWIVSQLPTRLGDVLDLGCGAGALARAVAPRAASVHGVDLSPEMVRAARARTTMDHVRFEEADVLAWDWPVDAYDLIVSVNTLHHLPLGWTLEQLARALRPGGRLLIVDLVRSEGPLDRLRDVRDLALRAASLLRHRRPRLSAAERAAWKRHAEGEIYASLPEVRAAAARTLPGAEVRRPVPFRYALRAVSPSGS